MKLMYKLKQKDSNLQGYSYRQITAIPICPMCYKELGHMLTSDTKFCPFCGAQIESNSIISVSLNAFEFNGEYLLKHNDIAIERDKGW
ncbi:hypothetical protein RASY3_14695 [Ruminococcus albus SY3]|uniref:Zinc-ribbon domain-containing protein n=1 Tax=Ruminococcus albus SY3 TaxID=1341156 RepID=A0A011UZF3_RUMAL|nr:hypothetical protein RASY3_14695 [Ruminococcus albus SY3]